MRKRFGKQELLAAVIIIGSAVIYWARSSTPGIVFSSEDQQSSTVEIGR